MVRGIVFAVLTVIAAACVPPPAPGGAPKVTAVVQCREERPKIGGGVFNLFFWKWTSVPEGSFRITDDVDGHVSYAALSNGATRWMKARGGWHIDWESRPEQWGRVLTLLAPDATRVSKCTWKVAPV